MSSNQPSWLIVIANCQDPLNRLLASSTACRAAFSASSKSPSDTAECTWCQYLYSSVEPACSDFCCSKVSGATSSSNCLDAKNQRLSLIVCSRLTSWFIDCWACSKACEIQF